MGREDYDDHIPASDVVVDDELHLTVMGGDEYVFITETHQYSQKGKVIEVTLTWNGWAGEQSDTIPADQMVWVKKRDRPEQMIEIPHSRLVELRSAELHNEDVIDYCHELVDLDEHGQTAANPYFTLAQKILSLAADCSCKEDGLKAGDDGFDPKCPVHGNRS